MRALKYLVLFACFIIALPGCSKFHQHNKIQIFRHLEESTVVLTGKTEADTYYGYCGGVYIKENLILTAFHCARNGVAAAKPELFGNEELPVEPNIIGERVNFNTHDDLKYYSSNNNLPHPNSSIIVATDPENDLALLLDVESSLGRNLKHDYVKISNEKTIENGEDVFLEGHPGMLLYSALQGTVASTRFVKKYVNDFDDRMVIVRVLQVNSGAYFGSSGSGVYSLDGELLGIASFITYRAPNELFFIHRDVIRIFLKREGL